MSNRINKSKSQSISRRSPPKKRLIICLDGTWNSYIDHRGNEDTDWSNVQKIRALIKTSDNNTPQIVTYSRGLGTGNNIDKWLGGLVAEGIDDQILDAYMMVCDNYNPNDEIFLFGFSRGAVAARALADMLSCCGIIKSQSKSKEVIKDAWNHFCCPPAERSANVGRESRLKNATLSKTPKIKFIGVWDTVFGGQITKTRSIFGSTRFTVKSKFTLSKLRFAQQPLLNSNIEHAYHALAIDEKRDVFRPIPWRTGANKPSNQILQQVWFPGSHSDVGGGNGNTGLSDISLKWMIKNAKKAGLAFENAMLVKMLNPDIRANVQDTNKGWKATGLSDRQIDLSGNEFENELLHSSAVCKFRTSNINNLSKYTPRILMEKYNANHKILALLKSQVCETNNIPKYKKDINRKTLPIKWVSPTTSN